MSQDTNIEWTEATWNPVVGCSRVSAGCDHCYAVGMTRRLSASATSRKAHQAKGRTRNYVGLTVEQKPEAIARGIGVGGYHFNGEVRCVPEALGEPLKWKKPRRIFVNSMSDLFHPDVPFKFIAEVFTAMAQALQHTYQILTKRPERLVEFFEWNYPPAKMSRDAAIEDWLGCWPNVWLGTSVEDQAAADERIPDVKRTPAAVHFLSCEPLIGPIDLEQWLARDLLAGRDNGQGGVFDRREIDWVIVGGESGPGARPCNLAWIHKIVEQCHAAGVTCFVKQLGHVVHVPCYSGPAAENVWVTSRSGTRLHGEGRDACFESTMPGKGGDPEEWPESLRVRQYPAASGGKVETSKSQKVETGNSPWDVGVGAAI